MMTRTSRSKKDMEAKYCERRPLISEVFFAFVPSKDAWERELSRLGVDPHPYPTTAGHCTYFQSKEGQKICLVTIGEHCDEYKQPEGIPGLIAHEAMHVWREIRKDIGERKPSAEFEAYYLQHIFIELYSAYLETRGKKK